MTLFWIASLPFIAVFIAALAIGRSKSFWLPIAVAVFSLATDALCLHTIVVAPTCVTGESECLGVTAIAYLIAAFWCAPSIGFGLRRYSHVRFGFRRR
ncbi:hypothetical protein ACK9YZ_10960 [Rhizobium sp. ZK1]|uniref:hypothetical protein n=1 Tax=Rhizobium sp. ZK1 TaxID=3389872 RepID=UPI0039F6C36A